MSCPEGDSIPTVIGELALALHLGGSTELNAKLPSELSGLGSATETSVYKIQGGTVIFPTLEARNRVVAAHVFTERRKLPSSEQNWLDTAYDLWRHEVRNSDTATGRLLAHVHEVSDVFIMAAEAIEHKRIQVFHALLTLECVFPYIRRIPAEGVWKLCDAQHELTKNDIAAGAFFGKLGKAFIEQPNVCRELHQRLRLEATESTANLHPTAIMALAKSSPDEALKLTLADTNSTNLTLKSVALWTLAQLIIENVVDNGSLPEVTAVFQKNMSGSPSTVRRTAIRSAAIASRVTNSFVDTVTRLGELQDEDALGAIAEALSRNWQEMKLKPYAHDWIRLLCKTPSSAKITLDQFDLLLGQSLDDESEHSFVVSCLTEWVGLHGTDGPRNESFPRLFDLVTTEIAKRPHLLSLLITDWLLSAGHRHPACVAGMLSYLGVHGLKKPTFDRAKLDTLDETDLLFLARRLVGFIFSEDHLLSLAISLSATRDAALRVFPLMRSLFVDELGYDYPSSAIEALEAAKSAATDASHGEFFGHIIETIRSRMKALDDLPRLIELEPPPGLRRQLVRARAKQMSAAMDDARQESVIRRFVTEVPIKGGTGYFSFREGAYTEPGHLKSLSHSINLPRRVVLDTVGYELSLLMLREAKREES